MVNKFCKKYNISIETIENNPIEITDDGVLLRYIKNATEIGTETILKGKAINCTGERLFFDIEAINDYNECIVTDSYIEKISYNEIDFKNVVATPNNSSNYDYINNCIDYFESMKTIYLSISDKRVETEIARRLDKVKCKIIDYGEYYSANNLLKQPNAKDIATNILQQSQYYPIDGIFLAKDLEKSILDIYENGLPNGAITPFANFNELAQFFPGMLCMVYGYPSHGKTTFLNQILHGFWKLNNWKTGIYSPEYWKIQLHYLVMAETIIKKPSIDRDENIIPKMTAEELRFAINDMNDWFYKVEPDGNRTIDSILDKQIELVKRYGISCFVIDPWATITHSHSGNEPKADYIAEVLYKIKRVGGQYGVCNIMVAHPKNPDTRTGALPPPPQMRDISGGASFINLGDLGISVYRNRLDNEPDLTSLIVQKNRMEGFTGKTGIASLQFNPYEYQFEPSMRTINSIGELQ